MCRYCFFGVMAVVFGANKLCAGGGRTCIERYFWLFAGLGYGLEMMICWWATNNNGAKNVVPSPDTDKQIDAAVDVSPTTRID